MNNEAEMILSYLNKNKTKNAEHLIKFIKSVGDLYSRNNDDGHITASAFIRL